MKQLPLFSPMARNTDPATSHQSAAVVQPELGKIQKLVLEAFQDCGPMTARTCERLNRFHEYGFSTIRKRISELAKGGLLIADGVDSTRRAPATIYRAPPNESQ